MQEECIFIHNWEKKKANFSLHLHFKKNGCKGIQSTASMGKKNWSMCGVGRVTRQVLSESWRGDESMQERGDVGRKQQQGWLEGQTLLPADSADLALTNSLQLIRTSYREALHYYWSVLSEKKFPVFPRNVFAQRQRSEADLPGDRRGLLPSSRRQACLVSQAHSHPCDTATRELWSCFLHAASAVRSSRVTWHELWGTERCKPWLCLEHAALWMLMKKHSIIKKSSVLQLWAHLQSTGGNTLKGLLSFKDSLSAF